MTETTLTQNPADDRDARLDLLTEQVERLTGTLAKFTAGFGNQVVQFLSGQQQTAPTGAKRRGRPPKTEQIDAAPREPHPFQRQCLELLERNGGRMTQTELAQALKKERSQVEYHMCGRKNENNAVRHKRAYKVMEYPHGVETVVYYTPKAAPFKAK